MTSSAKNPNEATLRLRALVEDEGAPCDTAQLKRLLAEGADVGVLDEDDGGSLLHGAAVVGNAEYLPILVEAGVALNGRDWFQQTPLHNAASLGRVECVQALVVLGAQLDVVDEVGVSPAKAAAYNGHLAVTRILVEAGATYQNIGGFGGRR